MADLAFSHGLSLWGVCGGCFGCCLFVLSFIGLSFSLDPLERGGY